jgi:type VI secretion system ImpM family protein
MTASSGIPGFFGKLPSRGDFVSRRLPKDFVERWDAWLQGALAASRAELGHDWLEIYLTSPIWRFAFAPGVCGEQAQIGVMMPSVDKVGRYFPLTAAIACGREGGSPLELAFDLAGWYAELEDLLLATLAEAPLELETFDERLARLGIEPAAAGASRGAPLPARGVAPLPGGGGPMPWNGDTAPRGDNARPASGGTATAPDESTTIPRSAMTASRIAAASPGGNAHAGPSGIAAAASGGAAATRNGIASAAPNGIAGANANANANANGIASTSNETDPTAPKGTAAPTLSGLAPPASTASFASAAGYRRLAAAAGTPLRDTVRRIAAQLREDPLGWRCVLWTDGSERVEPSVLIAPGLPPSEAFAALLDGHWDARGWLSSPDSVPSNAVGAFSAGRAAAYTRATDLDRAAAGALAWRAAAVTDPGKARTRNEDSFAYREDLGVFVVADGLGGHQAGEIASRMVTSVVDQLADAGGLQQRIDRFVHALGVVNGCLQVLAERQPGVELAASTVAALLLENVTAACIWAGDSRVYRLRDGELRRLSRDHSEAEDGAADNHVVTRAVGAPDPLEVDVEHTDARAGDRYLLCSDGLYGEAAPGEIAAALSLPAPEQACAYLKEAALRGEAPDNLTGVVVYLERAG